MINAINAVFLDCYSVTQRCYGKETAMKNYSSRKTLLHIVNDADVFLKNLLRLKRDMEAIRRNVELAYGTRVKVVRTVQKREEAWSTGES